MSRRRLRRQLNLAQIVMLGTAGAIGAEIFVLTGHAAGIAGPAAVLALLAGGLLSYSVALNYCELATAYPVTGGAMTYVRAAWGNGLLSFLVGSLDCLSSTFYSALSAVGFAYSLQVFIPALPIVPAAIAIIAVFTLLNILGANRVGNAQIILGAVLLAILAAYVILGLARPGGFDWKVFSTGGLLPYRDTGANAGALLRTIALIYVAYIGFEVIADDAEEITNPNRNIPRGILISLTLVMIINVLTMLVTLGTIPWRQLAGSETALTDAARQFMPRWGVPLMAIAGIIATLTTINTSMLSATREAFTLSRDGAWPRVLSRLGYFRTPSMSILAIGTISGLITAIGLVDFLSYISSAGYLFVLFWASLAMIRLRRLHPDLERPFKAPLFPLTAYLAAAMCMLIVVFTDVRALLFGVGVIVVCTIAYYSARPIARAFEARVATTKPAQSRILVWADKPHSVPHLIRLAAPLAQASEHTSVSVLDVVHAGHRLPRRAGSRLMGHVRARQRDLFDSITRYARRHGVRLSTIARTAPTPAQAILDEIAQRDDISLVLLASSGPLIVEQIADSVVKMVLAGARTNVAVLHDHGLRQIRRILVPIGGGPHARLAIRLADVISEQEDADLTALHALPPATAEEAIEDQALRLREIIEDELGDVPARIAIRVPPAGSILDGILTEVRRQRYDLIVIGASEEWISHSQLFGTIDDQLAEQAACSVLLVRRHEPVTIAWLRRQARRIEHEYADSDL
jgi:amino acid transporter/nucleotide-binding universal stress UspA family protein